MHRVRRLFRWGVENELVSPSILQALEAVAGLQKGKTEAYETEPVRRTADAVVADSEHSPCALTRSTEHTAVLWKSTGHKSASGGEPSVLLANGTHRCISPQSTARAKKHSRHPEIYRLTSERGRSNTAGHQTDCDIERATEIRKQFGLEAAQAILGHANADVTQIYAERDLGLAERVMREVG